MTSTGGNHPSLVISAPLKELSKEKITFLGTNLAGTFSILALAKAE